MQIRQKHLNDLLCKFGPFSLQHSKTFDISHTFLQVTVAELSTLKQIWFFGPPCSTDLQHRTKSDKNASCRKSLLRFS